MKLLTLYNKNVSISYKHSVCSFASLFAAVSLIFVCTVPYYFICYVNSDLWWQPHMIWEQPNVRFQYRYILMGEHQATGGDDSRVSKRPLVVISSFDRFNAATEKWQTSATVKVISSECVVCRNNGLQKKRLIGGCSTQMQAQTSCN